MDRSLNLHHLFGNVGQNLNVCIFNSIILYLGIQYKFKTFSFRGDIRAIKTACLFPSNHNTTCLTTTRETSPHRANKEKQFPLTGHGDELDPCLFNFVSTRSPKVLKLLSHHYSSWHILFGSNLFWNPVISKFLCTIFLSKPHPLSPFWVLSLLTTQGHSSSNCSHPFLNTGLSLNTK